MSISLGPFTTGTPFVTIQSIRLLEKKTGGYDVSISVSNERVIEPGARVGKLTFKNFIYLTDSLTEVQSLSSDTDALRQAITNNPSNCFSIAANRDEFKLKTETENNKKIFSYLFKRTFVANGPNIYALVCGYKEKNGSIIINNTVKETILVNDQSPNAAYVYRLAESQPQYGSENSVWPGSAHAQGQAYMVGNGHSDITHPNLNRIEVPNIRLKDLRIIDAANSLSYTFEVADEEYFSPVTLSRGQDGKVNGTFVFNLKNFIINNTRFGGLILNEDTLYAAAAVKDIVISQRITGQDTTGNVLTPGVVTRTQRARVSRYTRVAALNNNCSIVDNLVDNDGILNVFFTDDTTADYNSGTAEYRAEVRLNDNTLEVLDETVAPVRGLLAQISDRRRTTNEAVTIRQLIDAYLSALKTIFGSSAFGTYSEASWQKNLQAMVSEYNPEYVSDKILVLKIIESFVLKIKNLTKQALKTSDTLDVNSAVYRSKKSSSRFAVRVFKDTYAFTGTSNFGLDYIDDTITVQNGIPAISFEEYTNRVDSEVQKYGIINTEATALNKFGWVSPSSYNLTTNPLKIDTRNIKVPTKNSLPAIRNKVQNKKVNDVNKKLKDSDTKKLILNSLNVSVRPNPTPVRELVKPNQKKMLRDIVDSSEYLSSTSDFVYEKTGAPSGSTETLIRNNSVTQVMRSTLVDNLIEKTVTSFTDANKIVNTPSLAGSPALFAYEQDNKVLTEASAFSKAMNFNSVAKVQYLDTSDATKGQWKQLDRQAYNKSVESGKPLLCKLTKNDGGLGKDVYDAEPLASMFVLGKTETNKPKRNIKQVIDSNKQQVAQLSALPNEAVTVDDVEILYSKNSPLIVFPAPEALEAAQQQTIVQAPAGIPGFTLPTPSAPATPQLREVSPPSTTIPKVQTSREKKNQKIQKNTQTKQTKSSRNTNKTLRSNKY